MEPCKPNDWPNRKETDYSLNDGDTSVKEKHVPEKSILSNIFWTELGTVRSWFKLGQILWNHEFGVDTSFSQSVLYWSLMETTTPVSNNKASLRLERSWILSFFTVNRKSLRKWVALLKWFRATCSGYRYLTVNSELHTLKSIKFLGSMLLSYIVFSFI